MTIELSVKDNGIGIPQARRILIFETILPGPLRKCQHLGIGNRALDCPMVRALVDYAARKYPK
jgi:hypothetical protein